MNMNLSSNQAEEVIQRRTPSSIGLIIITAVFIATAMVTGGLILWKGNLKKQVDAADATYDEKYKKLINEDRNKDVVSFQNRITMANELINEKNIVLDSLQLVEKDMVPGVYLKSYNSNKKGKSISLEGISESMDAIAKQIVSFKSSEMFSAADVTSIGLSPEGKIEFSMEIKMN